MKQLEKIKKWFKKIPKILNSIILCIRFPFLYPRNVFTDKHYNNWEINYWIKEHLPHAKVIFHIIEEEREKLKDDIQEKVAFTTTTSYTKELKIDDISLSLISKDNFNTITIYNTITNKEYLTFDISKTVKNIERITDICFLTKEIKYKTIDHVITNYTICLIVDKKEDRTFYCLFPEIIINKFLLKKIQFLEFIDNTILQIFHCLPTYTILDAMDSGWRKKFGIDLCKEIRSELIKCGWKYLFKYRVVQVKEKFGSLRWYDEYEPINSKIFEIIQKYEHISRHTCVDCGNEAIWLTEGYILPYCNDCIEKINHFDKKIKDYGITKNPYSDYWLDENNEIEENET